MLKMITFSRATRRSSAPDFEQVNTESPTVDDPKLRRSTVPNVPVGLLYNSEKLDLKSFYNVNEKIFANGMLSCSHRRTGRVYALKSIKKAVSKKGHYIQNEELDIVKELREHPNILRIFESFETKASIHMIFEVCTGESLLQCLQNQKDFKFSEKNARDLMTDIISAVRYCHDHQIVHRNLKLQSFVFKTSSFASRLKLVDFSLAQRFVEGEVLTIPVGSSLYVAPEVLRGKYTCKCDVWSLGVIAYMMLAGDAPFKGESEIDVLKNVLEASPTINELVFQQLSFNGMDFISTCLNANPDTRLTAEEINHHAWFTRSDTEIVSAVAIRRLKLFQFDSLLCRLFLFSVAMNLTDERIHFAKYEFDKFDHDRLGYITRTSLRKVLQAFYEMQNVHRTVEEIFIGLDIFRTGWYISYSGFVAAMLNAPALQDRDLRHGFYMISGQASTISLQNIRQMLGKEYSEQEVDTAVRAMNVDPLTCQISYDDFRAIILNRPVIPASNRSLSSHPPGTTAVSETGSQKSSEGKDPKVAPRPGNLLGWVNTVTRMEGGNLPRFYPHFSFSSSICP